MNAINRSIDSYTAFQTQAERTGSLRVSAPPRRSDSSNYVAQTESGNAASQNPVDLNEFANFQAMLRNELSPAAVNGEADISSLSRTLDEIAAEVRGGSFTVDATATAARLNNLELLLR